MSSLKNLFAMYTNIEILKKPIDQFNLASSINRKVLDRVACVSYMPSPIIEELNILSEKSPNHSSGSKPAISMQTIAKEMMLDMEEYKFLLNVYISSNGKLIEKIEQNFKDRNHVELHKLLHALRGSSSNLFLKEMANQCATVESLIRKYKYDEAYTEFKKTKEIFKMISDVQNN